MKYFFNKEIETLPLKELRDLQNKRLNTLIQRVYLQIPHYRKLLDQHNINPGKSYTVDDLHLFPFSHKTDLRDHYPFGLFAVPQSEVRRLHCSSGTTGKPIVVGYTDYDLYVFAEVVARSLAAAGCRPGMKLQNAYGYGLFTGGLGLHYGAEKLGMTVLPISGGGTEKQLMLMRDFQCDAISCTPSYALTLADAARRQGISNEELALKIAILGAEPWTESVRAEVEKNLSVQATNIYGLSEIIGPGVSQEDTDERGTGSYIWEDHFFPEVVNKDTGMPLPYGEQGVLVFTTLTKEACPLIRYWTNDITSIYYEQSASRTHIKMAPIAGRADDMLIIRGVNLFHTQVEAELENFGTLCNNYRLIVQKREAMDEVTVEVEVSNSFYEDFSREQPADIWQDHEHVQSLSGKLQHKLKQNTGLSMRVNILKPGSIPRSEGGKLQRISDLRENK